MEYGKQSLAIARQLELKEQVGNVLINLCWLYIAQKRLEAARQANLEAQDIWRSLGNIPRLLETYETQLSILIIAGDYEGVLATASETLRLSRSIGNRLGQGGALAFTGAVQAIQGQFGQALANIKAAMVLSKELGDPFSKQITYPWLTFLYLNAGAQDKAEAWADRLYAMRESFMPVFQT